MAPTCLGLSAASSVASSTMNELASSSSFALSTRKLFGKSTEMSSRTNSKSQVLHLVSQATEVTVDPLVKIREGFQKFKASRFSKEPTLFSALAESQSPKYMIFACADSRCDPALTLGLDLGEAFIVRNIANLVPPYDKSKGHTSAGSAIEYAVLHLKVQHILIIGHSRCGGIKALLGMKDDGSNRFSEYIEDWITVAAPAAKATKASYGPDCEFEQQWEMCVKESVKTSLRNCLTYPFVKEAVDHKKLTLHGAYYDFVKGEFEHWDV